jgi:hypothetical protein
MAMLAAAAPMVLGALGSAGAAAGGSGAMLSLGASALSGYGAIQSGKAENAASQYNATVNDMQARQSGEQAALKASEIARRSRQTQASGRASALANGFEQSGSVVDVLNQAARGDELDALTAIYDGSVQSTGLRNEAALNRSRGKSAKTAGYMSAASSLLSGASSVVKARQGRAANASI